MLRGRRIAGFVVIEVGGVVPIFFHFLFVAIAGFDGIVLLVHLVNTFSVGFEEDFSSSHFVMILSI